MEFKWDDTSNNISSEIENSKDKNAETDINKEIINYITTKKKLDKIPSPEKYLEMCKEEFRKMDKKTFFSK